MSLTNRRSSPGTPAQPAAWTHELKNRVIASLNKLSDRDTLALATAELESIARALTQDSFAPFLTCLHNTDASSKSPVRKQCVNLLGLLSRSHGDSLSPFLAKMISTVLRRLRDPDSAVRSACVDAVSAMSSQITKPPFSAFFKPLMEAITLEQDLNAQIGSALCLAAAIEAAPDPEVELLRKSLPRLGKLARSEGFKAKTALLVLLGSVIGVGGASSRGVLDWLVPCVVDFLSSEDWAARKAAAEALGKLALAERDLAAEYKASCLNSLESRRFDKVKVVRETMNQTLELWKDVPGASCVPSQSRSSVDNGSGGCSPPISKGSNYSSFKTPQPKKTVPTNRPPPSAISFVTTAKRESPPKSNDSNSSTDMFYKLDHKKQFDRKVEVTVSNSSSSSVACEDGNKRSDFRNFESTQNENSKSSRRETKRVLFSKIRDEKVHKFGGIRSGSRVFPFQEDENPDLGVVVSNTVEEAYENSKDVEDLSLIREEAYENGKDVEDLSLIREETNENSKDVEDLSLIREQLLQIENQQCSLLDLLQRFIGSSQSGINSLETRVHGIEMALDEISYDLAISSGRIPSADGAENTCCKLPGAENTCCKLPGAEFLSSKFWKRAEGRYSTSRFPSSGTIPSPNIMRSAPSKDGIPKSCNLESQRFQLQNGYEYDGKPLTGGRADSRGNLRRCLNSTQKNIIQDVDDVQVRKASGLDRAAPASFAA